MRTLGQRGSRGTLPSRSRSAGATFRRRGTRRRSGSRRAPAVEHGRQRLDLLQAGARRCHLGQNLHELAQQHSLDSRRLALLLFSCMCVLPIANTASEPAPASTPVPAPSQVRVHARVERFVEPALLLLLQGAAHARIRPARTAAGADRRPARGDGQPLPAAAGAGGRGHRHVGVGRDVPRTRQAAVRTYERGLAAARPVGRRSSALAGAKRCLFRTLRLGREVNHAQRTPKTRPRTPFPPPVPEPHRASSSAWRLTSAISSRSSRISTT